MLSVKSRCRARSRSGTVVHSVNRSLGRLNRARLDGLRAGTGAALTQYAFGFAYQPRYPLSADMCSGVFRRWARKLRRRTKSVWAGAGREDEMGLR
jgi:hypothetical protein